MPSLKPCRLRGVSWLGRRRRGAAEAELRPAQRRRAPRPMRAEVADGVERDLRVVGAGLDAEVAAASGRVELVAGERASGAQRAGPAARPSPKRPPREDAGPEAERDRQPGRRRGRAPRRCRRAAAIGGSSGRPSGSPGAHRARPPSVHVAQQLAQLGAGRSSVRSNARERRAGPAPAWRSRPGARRRTGHVRRSPARPRRRGRARSRRRPPRRGRPRRRRPRRASAGVRPRLADRPDRLSRRPCRPPSRAARRARRPRGRARGGRPASARRRAA